MDIAVVSTIISLAAFGVAAYGILERRNAANRAERIRLTTIVEDIGKLNQEIQGLLSKGIMSGDMVGAVHSRQELLSQQALSLIREHSLTITSTECREVAYCLEETGFREDAEEIWALARDTADKEGETQAFFASRGYAYFLFRTQREAEARDVLCKTLASHATDTDLGRLAHVETLSAWATWEIATQGPGAEIVAKLGDQIEALIAACITPRGRELTSGYSLKKDKAIDGGSTEKAPGSSQTREAGKRNL